MRKLTAILLTIFIIVICLGALLVTGWVRDIPAEAVDSAAFDAVVQDAGGVDVASTFRITFTQNVGSAAVQRALSISPAVEFSVHQGTKKEEILIVPAQPLDPGVDYTFTLATDETEAAWTCRTKRPLLVRATSPLDNACDETPHDIRITFNQALPLDLDRVAKYIMISPQIAGDFTQEGDTLIFTPLEGFAPGVAYTVTVAAGLPLSDTDVTLNEAYLFSFETRISTAVARLRVRSEETYNSGMQPVFHVYADKSLLPAIDDNETERPLAARVQLFVFDNAEDYAALLAQVMQAHPAWGEGYEYVHNLPTEGLELRSTMSLPLLPSKNYYTLTWPSAPPDGYYLLRINLGGESRDMLFAVSSLEVYTLSCGMDVLFWLHDAADGSTLTAAEIDVYDSNSMAYTDSDGVGRLLRQAEDEIYLISYGDKNTVTTQRRLTVNSDTFANWRYLYLNKSIYTPNEQLHYWGLVSPRDGTELEYERVSVYIYAANALRGDYLCHDYAALSNNMFSGQIDLSALKDGDYTLEIWQSGRRLISRAFSVGKNKIDIGNVSSSNGQKLLLDSDNGYAPGDTLAASFHQGQGQYLFLTLAGGLHTAQVNDNELYLTAFNPPNRLNEYLLSICYGEDGYISSAPTLLYLDYAQYRLNVEISTEATEAGLTVSVGVTNSTGQAVKNAQIALSLFKLDEDEELTPADPLDAIYKDYQDSGLSVTAPATPVAVGDCMQFITLTTDENGLATGKIKQPDGLFALQAQAIANKDMPQAGCTIVALP